MKTIIDTIVKSHMVRRTNKQKEAFRTYVQDQLQQKGYSVNVEEAPYVLKNKNIIIGDLKTAEAVVCAHYDTPATMPIANFNWPANKGLSIGVQVLMVLGILWLYWVLSYIISGLVGLFYPSLSILGSLAVLVLLLAAFFAIPNQNNYNDNTSGVAGLLNTLEKLGTDKTAYILFDNEEWGLLGSRGYLKLHGDEAKAKLLINMDCIGDGDHMFLMPSLALLEQNSMNDKLTLAAQKACTETKSVHVFALDKSHYPSDQAGFPRAIVLVAAEQSKEAKQAEKEAKPASLFVGKIHTNDDKHLDMANIDLVCGLIQDILN